MTATATFPSTDGALLVRHALGGDTSAFAPGYVCHAPPELSELFEADCPSAGTAKHEPHAAPFSDEEIRIGELTASGDRVVARFVGTAKHVGAYRGVPPSGRARSAHVLAVYRIDGDRIAEGWGTISWDQARQRLEGDLTMSLLTRTVTGLQSRVVRLGGRRAEGSVDGLPLALLTTRGRYAREQRTVPLPYVEDGDRIALAASSAGSNLHPAWYQNLVADPEVTFEVRGAHRQMRASVASESERARIYDAFKRRSPRYARYEQKSARTIPVVLLREAPRAARDLHAA